MISTLLIFFAEEEHVNELAKNMFKAKTAYLTSLSPFAMVRADQKVCRVNHSDLKRAAFFF